MKQPAHYGMHSYHSVTQAAMLCVCDLKCPKGMYPRKASAGASVSRSSPCRRLDEQTKLSDAVRRHMQPQAGQASMQALLQQYVEAGINKLGLLLGMRQTPVSHP